MKVPIETGSKDAKTLVNTQAGSEKIQSANQSEEINIMKNVKPEVAVNISKVLIDNNTELHEKNNEFIKFEEVVKHITEEKSEVRFKDITESVKDILKNVFSENNISKNNTTESIIQKIVFLTKSGIDISINNLDKLTRLIEKGETLNNQLEEVVKIAAKDGIIDEKTKEDILSKTKNLNIKFDNNDAIRIKDYYRELSDTMEKLLANISSKEKVSEELNLKARSLNDNIDFINKINDKSTMMLIPFNLNNREIQNNLYILSKRKVAKKV
ncbi:hypothetical protein Curi_c16150 [Gottschalkia acidurici 9a]|uniref:Uncharacterized protein n=2 Tax=Clostridium acidurici TaxID=1556 RepID=K0AXT6_GOTA9|nr:hypothetical protein Curi_c16150 [Gottschalkia acidurici 9a]